MLASGQETAVACSGHDTSDSGEPLTNVDDFAADVDLLPQSDWPVVCHRKGPGDFAPVPTAILIRETDRRACVHMSVAC